MPGKNKSQSTVHLSLLLAALLGPLAAQAGETVQRLLEAEQPPPGVVFEIVEADGDALRWALPAVERHARALRKRFPDLDIAVVTHGREEFALLTKRRGEYGEVHGRVQQLVRDRRITVHVCGTYATWNDYAPEDFPDYVNVSAAGPAQINDYRALGFVVIRLRTPGN